MFLKKLKEWRDHGWKLRNNIIEKQKKLNGKT